MSIRTGKNHIQPNKRACDYVRPIDYKWSVNEAWAVAVLSVCSVAFPEFGIKIFVLRISFSSEHGY